MARPQALSLPPLAFLAACTALSGPPTQDPPPTGLDALQFYGDMRLRQESTHRIPDTPNRDRSRGRFRLGVNYQVEPELTVGARVVSGDRADARSNHVTYGDGLDGMEVSLDRAFLTYRPSALEGAEVTAGKFNHFFYRNQVYGELVWDADIQPEGLILRETIEDLGPGQRLDMILGGYSLIEQGRADDGFAIVGQVAMHSQLSKDLEATLAAGYYHYTDVTPDGGSLLLDDNAGNRTLDLDADGTPDDFASDFGIANVILGLRYTADLPIHFAAESIQNRRGNDSQTDGWAVGLALGQTRRPGDWRIYYQLQNIERESVFSPFAQDDFVFATGHSSQIIGLERRLTSKVRLHFFALLSSPEDDPTDDIERQRFRLDLDLKF